MSKGLRHYKKTLRKRKLRRRKTRRQKLKAGNGEKVKCCMCERMVNKNDTLIPRECLTKHGMAAHRICQDCWWDPVNGFAREEASHKCPGCVKELPLTEFKKSEPIFIDLTEE